MPTWGISAEFGFYRPNLAEIIEDAQQDMKDTFGGELNVGDNSRAGMLVKVQSGREFKTWQQMEAVYNSQTKNGAEGSFLDELYAYQGITRNPATFGTGVTVIETDDTAEDITEIPIDTTFNATNGLQYKSETSRAISDFVRAYKIQGTSLQVGTYTITITNSANIITSATYSLISNDDADRITFFNNLKTFFDEALPNDTSVILIDTTAGDVSFYVGYVLSGSDYLLTGTTEVFKMKFGTLRIGNRFSESSVLATESGFNPLAPNNITSMTPTPLGYVSVTNLEDFFSGTDVESDAAFAVRAETQSDAPNSGTRPAILAELNAIDTVVGASLDKIVNLSTGVVTVEPILFGGETAEIAQVLYDTQPINNQYIGDISYTVQTEDGKTEDIKFSRGVDLNMSVRVEYKPLNGIPLSTDEQDDIKTSIENVNSNISVGGTVFNGQLAGAVFDVNPSRFTEMVVKIKLESEPSGSYSTDDYVPAARELPILSEDRVEIIQIN